jgi:hypothetical protein
VLIAFAAAAALLCSPARCPGEDQFLARSLRARILVHEPDRTVQSLVRWTEERGGYFTYRSSQRVLLRVPNESAEPFRVFLKEQAEELLEITLDARDLRQAVARVRAGIESRREILDRNLASLRRADVAGTLAIEREIMRLVEEIETLKGERRKLEQDRRFLTAEVLLSFQDTALPQDMPSLFRWINQIDFYRYMEEGIVR